jgi:hypothetical protein
MTESRFGSSSSGPGGRLFMFSEFLRVRLPNGDIAMHTLGLFG